MSRLFVSPIYDSLLFFSAHWFMKRLETSKSPSFEPKAFSLSASWDELRDHCIGMHPDACADVARLQPAEIFELRRRLSS